MKMILLIAFSLISSPALFSQKWQPVDSVNSSYYHIYFYNDNIGFLSGSNMYKATRDGGKTWTTYDTYYWLSPSFHFINPDTGFMQSMKTHDGGETWEDIPIGEFYCFTPDNRYAYSVPLTILDEYPTFGSSNSGEDWETRGMVKSQVENAFTTWAFDIAFADSANGMIAAGAGQVFVTHDGAKTWTARHPLDHFWNTSCISAVNENKFYAGAKLDFVSLGPDYSYIVRTLNGGEKWDTVSTVYGEVKKIKMLDNGIGYLLTDFAFYTTMDEGHTWDYDSTLYMPVDFHLTKDNSLYVLTWDSVVKNGKIYKRHLINDIPLVRQTSANLNVFPNPTAGNWQLTSDPTQLGSMVELSDNSGRILYSSLIQSPTTILPATGLAEGIYILRVVNINGNVEIKKLVKR